MLGHASPSLDHHELTFTLYVRTIGFPAVGVINTLKMYAPEEVNGIVDVPLIVTLPGSM